MSLRTDEEIAGEVAEGDSQSFGVLVERYEEKLLRYARKFLFDPDEARDLVQEIFIKAYNNIKSFDLGRKFSPWIYRIAHNEFINAIKAKKGRNTISIIDFDVFFPHPIAEEAPDTDAEREEMRRMIDRGLGELDVKYREALTLYYFEEMNYGEIADVLEVPVPTVGIRLRRGKAQLRRIIEKNGR